MFDSGLIESLFKKNEEYSHTYIIAEIGINHNGSLSTALALMEAAKTAGVDAVKFQKRDLSQIYSSLVLEDANNSEWNFEYLIPLLKDVELSIEDYSIIRQECNRLELDLIVTPFDEKSAKIVADLGVSAFKIASADMTNIPLLASCRSYGKPLLISVGMWDEQDIRECVEIFRGWDINYALLLAQSTYPAAYDSINLGFINTLRSLSDIVGYSGHERGIFIPVAAVAMGCKIIEKHITFDKNSKGPDHKASMLPDEWEAMVHQIRMLENSLGENKEVNQAEKLTKEAFAKSAVPRRDLPVGHILNEEDIIYKSPGKGIFPHQIHKYIGKKLRKAVKKEHFINETDFKKIINIDQWKSFTFKKNWGLKCRFHDYDIFKVLQSPCIEFHCSQTDLDVEFKADRSESRLIVHAPEIYDRQLVDICSENSDKVQSSLIILQRSIDKTLKLSKFFPYHKPKLVVHLGGMFLDVEQMEDTSALTDRAIENFAKLDFDSDAIEILPENLPPRPWYLGGEWFQHGFMYASDMLSFCSYFDFKMVYDVCHADLYCNKFNISLLDYTKKVMPFVSHVHISDANGVNGEGLQIGEGDIDFHNLLEAMQDFQFTWVPEIWSGHLHQASGMYECLIKLEKYSGML